MRAALLALLFFWLPPLVVGAQTNIRATCALPDRSAYLADQCIVAVPNQYSGGDTIYLRAFSAGLFVTADPNHPGTAGSMTIGNGAIVSTNLSPAGHYIWDDYSAWTELSAPGAADAGYDFVYAKASAGLCAKDAGGTERCMQQLALLSEPQCTRYANLAANTDSFIAPQPVAGTLTKVWCITSGTIVTAPTIALAECSSTGTACSDNTSALTCDGDGDATTTFGGAGGSAVDANDWMQANVTNTPSVTAGETVFCYQASPTP